VSAWTVGAEDLVLREHGEPRLLLGGQVHNSSSSSPAAIRESFAHVRRLGGNTVIAPVSWALTEPDEGSFDFRLVDEMIRHAVAQGLRLVPLWFGAFKNAGSGYAPRWVRADRARFPRAVVTAAKAGRAFDYAGATPLPVLSAFSPDLREADARAFEAFIAHLAGNDDTDAVALVQVENETGLLRDSRDRSDIAAAAWADAVPPRLIDAARVSGPESMLGMLWRERGGRSSGTWSEVLGDGPDADEVFMAWAIGSYVEELAARGRAIKEIPMYANAWLGPQPGQEEPGQWPSGGPSGRVIDVWHAAAPSLALVGPDIYVDDAAPVMRTYASGGQPLFVPECRLRAAELVRAIGAFGAIGWSGFGIDGANPDGQVAATLGLLAALETPIATAQAEGRIAGLVVEEGCKTADAVIGDLEVSARGVTGLLRDFLLDVGVQLPEEALPVPDETLPGEAVPAPGEQRPFALVFAEADDAFIVIGRDVKVDFASAGAPVEYDEVVELLLEDGGLVEGRVLNGDERLQIVPLDRVGAARVRLLRT